MIDLAHGRRRFHTPDDPNTATAYRPFVLDMKVPYWLRFVWTGEPNHTSDEEGPSPRRAAGLATNAGGKGDASLYWKVVASGEIAQSVSDGEGDGGDVIFLIQCKD